MQDLDEGGPSRKRKRESDPLSPDTKLEKTKEIVDTAKNPSEGSLRVGLVGMLCEN